MVNRANDGEDDGISWEVLNAYLDDELPLSEAGQVLIAISDNPEIARRVATLARLRSVTRQLEVEQLAPGLISSGRAAWRPAVSAWLVALAVPVLVSMAICSLFLEQVKNRATGDIPLERGVHEYEKWIVAERGKPPGDGEVILVGSQAVRRPLDLSAASLELAYVTAASTGAGDVFAGYRGRRGCRVGLWMAPASNHGRSEPASADTGKLRVRVWSTRDGDYALISEGLDPDRLNRLADAIAGLSRDEVTDAQVALLRGADTGKPCQL